jgi:CheY-like chemotaxis protein
MRILIVDDEELQRRILGNFLSEQGYDVLTAAPRPCAWYGNTMSNWCCWTTACRT